jgi:DsbC/DsbD-like thiol-disulfide interchange protein
MTQRMPHSFHRFGLVIALLAQASFSAHAADVVSAWSEDLQSRMRLISSGAATPDAAAAIEVLLQPGFKTYWRSPGESGVPPEFDFSGSENLDRAEVLFPRPSQFVDASGVAIGYHDRVIFPVRVVATDANKPVRLAVTMRYGACDKICIPAVGSASLSLGGAPDSALAADLAAANAAVPVQITGAGRAGEPFRLLEIGKPKIEATPNGPTARLLLEVEGAASALFVEGPDRWYFETTTAEPTAKGMRFTINLYGPKKDPTLKPCPLTLTIVGEASAVERHVTLDECGVKP